MDDILTPIVSIIGSAVISFLVAKYYGEHMHAYEIYDKHKSMFRIQ